MKTCFPGTEDTQAAAVGLLVGICVVFFVHISAVELGFFIRLLNNKPMPVNFTFPSSVRKSVIYM